MNKIHILTPELANQIAAGEVVERPASVVKELIENSIDAGANQIEIVIKDSGRTSIMVRDNGMGMNREDALLAFTRHATSKIYGAQDLFAIKSLGFRGEALPSLAAVSRVTLTTSNGDEVGTKFRVIDNQITQIENSDARRGTTIVVEELFYQTPARLKHLKSDYTELAQIVDVTSKLALAHPDVRMQLSNEETLLFQSSGLGKSLEIIANLYGVETAKLMIPVDFHDYDFKVSGYIGKASLTKANRNAMIFLLNGRNVRIPVLQSVVMEGYRHYISDTRFPMAILTIEADPSLVDVNVHPAKHEVRLSKEDALTRLVRDGIAQALRQTSMVPVVSLEKKDTMIPQNLDNQLWSNTQSIQYGIPSYRETLNTEAPISMVLKEEPDSSYSTSGKMLPPMFPVGQLHGTYLIAQSPDGFYLIDQHAAAERIKFEKYSRLIDQSGNQIELLIPHIVELSYQDATKLQERYSLLESIGLKAEPFGHNGLRITAVPVWMQEVDLNGYVSDMVEQILKNQSISLTALRSHALESLSCKAALKANKSLDFSEMEALLHDLRQCENPHTCPHGRPTMIYYSTYELEKLFKRTGGF